MNNMSEEEKSEKSKTRGIIKEHYTFGIALIVVISYMIFFGVVLIVFKDMVMLEKMTALLSGLVAAVVGYYFGQRPVQELSNQVKTAQQEKYDEKKEKETTKNQYKGSKEMMAEILEDYDNQKKQIDELREDVRRLRNE